MSFLCSPPGDDPVILQGIFPAPCARVWQAWTHADEMIQWFGRHQARFVSGALDLRPGGTWRFERAEVAGVRESLQGTYREIAPQERLVFTWQHVKEEGSTRQESPLSLVTLDFTDLGARTRLDLRHEGLSNSLARQNVTGGWGESLTALLALLEERDDAAPHPAG
ncbi:MAG: SRPBCC domain-containing protein [Neomegalonema sp.]|nr:SRPBCC domain-containing protein [Neomegalonema sp.]